MAIELDRLLDSSYRLLVGEDVFISYSRADGGKYAKRLFVKLTDDPHL